MNQTNFEFLPLTGSFNPLNNPRSVYKGPVQVWLTSFFSLLAAIVGGWIAGQYAVHAQKHAAKEQRQSDLEAEAGQSTAPCKRSSPSWKFSTPSWLAN